MEICHFSSAANLDALMLKAPDQEIGRKLLVSPWIPLENAKMNYELP